MKRFVSLVLALTLALSLAAVAGISVSAEDQYDYYTILDAADHSTDESDFGRGEIESAYRDGITRSYNVQFAYEDLAGRRMLKVKRTGKYDGSSINYYDSQNMSTLAKNSVGFRVWVQAQEGNDNCNTTKNIISFGFDKVTQTVGEDNTTTTTHTIYCTADWGNPYLGTVSTEGGWLTFLWGSKGMNAGSNYVANNRFTFSGGASKKNVIDADFLASMQGIYVGISDSYNVGSVYYFDDFQFIYNKGDAPSGGVTEPTITMDAGASMRIDNKTHGIRFSATVEKDVLDAYTAAGATVTEVGTLIAKQETSEDKITIENAVESTEGNIAENPEVVVAKYANADMQAVEGANVYTIVGSLVELKPKNAEQGYVAKAYIKFKVGTETKVVYSNLSDARSIKEVATAVKADTTYYSSLCANHKAAVDKWL